MIAVDDFDLGVRRYVPRRDQPRFVDHELQLGFVFSPHHEQDQTF